MSNDLYEIIAAIRESIDEINRRIAKLTAKRDGEIKDGRNWSNINGHIAGLDEARYAPMDIFDDCKRRSGGGCRGSRNGRSEENREKEKE